MSTDPSSGPGARSAGARLRAQQARLSGVWTIVTDALGGRLRRRFYADVDAYADASDGARRVSAGYVCLAAVFLYGLAGVLVFALNLRNPAPLFVCLIGAGGCYAAFGQIRRRGDPTTRMAVMLSFASIGVAALSFLHRGLVAPAVSMLPVVATLSVLSLRGWARRAALGTVLVPIIVSWLTLSGRIGLPTTFSAEAYAITWTVGIVTALVFLIGAAWISTLARDYTLEKLNQARLTSLEDAERNRIAMEAAKVGLWDIPNLAQPRFHLSESFAALTGYDADELDGLFDQLDRFVHPDDIEALREAFRVGSDHTARIRIDFRLNTKKRGYRWFSAHARHSINPDGAMRISGSLQDITFIKTAEDALRAGSDRAREANQAKSDFIAVMSHEVRTPLNAILGGVELLKRTPQGRETAELVGLIDDAGQGLLAMVNDLLDVSKIEAGKVDVTPRSTDLAALISRTVDFWRPHASEKGLRLICDCREAGERRAMVDPMRVGQILGNLISNAVKFTDEGAVSIKLVVRGDDRGVGHLEVSVHDTGPGVPVDMTDTIFSPFEQSPSNRARGGTGLGLYISRRLARLMSGDIVLDAAAGPGSCFRLTLPAEFAEAVASVQPSVSAAPLWTGRRVLCVDDNEKNRRIVELLLAQFGVDVTTSASGAEALDLCGMMRFDVVLMDIVMPDMDGVETLKGLRSDETGCNHRTPVIALTAKLAPEDIAGYMDEGFDGVAGKPINVRTLAETLSPFLKAPSAEAA